MKTDRYIKKPYTHAGRSAIVNPLVPQDTGDTSQPAGTNSSRDVKYPEKSTPTMEITKTILTAFL